MKQQFLRTLDENEKSIEKRIEEKILIRGQDTQQLDKFSKMFDCEDTINVKDIKNILIYMENQANIKTIHPLIPYNEKYSKTRFFIRRVIRKLIGWYIEPIIYEQSEFNRLNIAAIIELNSKIEILERRINKR